MAIATYFPPPPLAEFVTQIWHCEDYVLPHGWERMMPTCGVTLLVNLAENELRWRPLGGQLLRASGISVCGPQPAPIEIDTAQQRFIMGVEFALGAAARLLGVPVVELAATHVSLADLLGREASLLHEQLVEAGSPEARFRVLTAWLARRAAASSEVTLGVPAMKLVSTMLDDANVRSVAARLNLSAKRFIGELRSQVGLAPKLFCRVRRFERLLSAIDGNPVIDWALTAARYGYCDQAHLAHEFRNLSGYTPREYLVRRGPYTHHVPLAD